MALNRISLEKELTDYRKSLEEQRELYRQLVEYANDMIIRTDRRGVINYINSAAERISGYGHDEMIGKRYLDFVHPDHRESQKQKHREQINAGQPTAYYELPLVAKDGGEFWIGQTLTIIQENGEVTGYHSIARDITRQKRLERMLKKRERNFRSLIENSMDLITIIAADSIILYQSPSSERVLGYQSTALIGEAMDSFVHPDDINSYMGVFDPADDEGDSAYKPVEYRIRHADGSWKTIESLGKSINDDEGLTAVILNSRDVTEKKAAEETVHQRNRDLQTINQDLENLYEISRALSKSIELEDILKEVLDAFLCMKRLRLKNKGAILLVNNGRLSVAHSVGLPESYTARYTDVIPANSPWIAAFENDTVIQCCPLDDDTSGQTPDGELERLTNLVIPLTAVHKTVGVICLYSAEAPALGDKDIKMLSAVGNQIGIAISNAQQFEETRTQSLRDPLTGVPNRRAMESELKQRIEEYHRYDRIFSVIMLDIDHFKQYNDTKGHIAGDHLLAKAAELLSGEIRKTDTLYRYGGEEFLVLLIETPSTTAEHVAERLRASVERHTGVTISLGVATADSKYRTGEDLVAAADRALYRAKEGGRNRVEIEP
ncbi:MAG TPA: PAS domain S-box protein [Spirochaetes bacterium]|nr:PAS domain S-box protein [Spirochaetota bacterium]